MDPLVPRIVSRFAGVVLPFPKPKAGGPTITISGKKYVLSTDGGPLGDLDDPVDPEWYGKARVIRGPITNKWKFLWAFDTDKQNLAMWRATDGNEKVWGSARSEMGRIVKLESKGQLNRVTHEEFRHIEAEMRRRADDQLQALKKTIEENKSEHERVLDQLLREYSEKFIEPKILKAIADVKAGAVPIGFKTFVPPEARNFERQATAFVIGQIFKRETAGRKVEEYLKQKGFDLARVHPQDIDWALDDLREKFYEHLPPR